MTRADRLGPGRGQAGGGGNGRPGGRSQRHGAQAADTRVAIDQFLVAETVDQVEAVSAWAALGAGGMRYLGVIDAKVSSPFFSKIFKG